MALKENPAAIHLRLGLKTENEPIKMQKFCKELLYFAPNKSKACFRLSGSAAYIPSIFASSSILSMGNGGSAKGFRAMDMSFIGL